MKKYILLVIFAITIPHIHGQQTYFNLADYPTETLLSSAELKNVLSDFTKNYPYYDDLVNVILNNDDSLIYMLSYKISPESINELSGKYITKTICVYYPSSGIFVNLVKNYDKYFPFNISRGDKQGEQVLLQILNFAEEQNIHLIINVRTNHCLYDDSLLSYEKDGKFILKDLRGVGYDSIEEFIQTNYGSVENYYNFYTEQSVRY